MSETTAGPPPDEAGFRDWAVRRMPNLRRTAYLLCGDWSAADDLVQDTLVTVYARWHRIVRRGAPDAYAQRVLMSRFVDARRRPWRREQAWAEVPDRADPSAARALDASESADAVLADALRAVPAEQRAVLVLRHIEDLPLDEVARVLDLPVGTVKSRAARGTQRLRAELALRGYEHPTPSTSGSGRTTS